MASFRLLATNAGKKTITSAKSSLETFKTRLLDIFMTEAEVGLTPQGALLTGSLVLTELADLGGVDWMLVVNEIANAEPDLNDLDLENLSEVLRADNQSK